MCVSYIIFKIYQRGQLKIHWIRNMKTKYQYTLCNIQKRDDLNYAAAEAWN
jgi:hypothetical protein